MGVSAPCVCQLQRCWQRAAAYSFRHLEFLQLQCFLELPLLGLFRPRCLHAHRVVQMCCEQTLTHNSPSTCNQGQCEQFVKESLNRSACDVVRETSMDRSFRSTRFAPQTSMLHPGERKFCIGYAANVAYLAGDATRDEFVCAGNKPGGSWGLLW